MISGKISKSASVAEPLIEALRQARARKGWSQRELSERARLTQANISRLERGALDVRLSTLLELARLLDLDLVLVPRTALTAVNAVLREIETNEEARLLRGIANTFQQILGRLQKRLPQDETVDRLAGLVAELDLLDALFLRLPVLHELAEIARQIDEAMGPVTVNRLRLKDAVNRLAHLKNTLVHPLSQAERPAYTLDVED